MLYVDLWLHGLLPAKPSSPEQPEYPPRQHHNSNYYSRKLEYCDFISTLGHAAQTPGGPFYGAREGGENFILHFPGGVVSWRRSWRGANTDAAINNILRSCVVVNINSYSAKGGDFRGKFGETGVVLSQWRTS